MFMKRILCASLVCLTTISVAQPTEAGVITKPPDQGEFWQPLRPNSGTYIYANSFVADESGLVSDLGMWIFAHGGGNDVRFEVYESLGGDSANGPDSTNVLATTGSISGIVDSALRFYSAAALGGGTPLVAGNTYWFAANTIGEAGTGYLQVGGHSQNSVYVDNGTFWYSNDPTGIYFDGRNLTPEMAFSVTIERAASAPAVPEPSTFALLGVGGIALVGYRWRCKRRQVS